MQAAAAVRVRHERNRHSFRLPEESGNGIPWHLAPKHRINLTRDHSSASENGVQAVFPEHDVFSANCTFHACPAYWSRDQNELWSNSDKDYKEETKAQMNQDFNFLKNCPHPHLAPHIKKALVEYWSEERGEPDLADAWMSTYGNSNLSRVLLCENYQLRGGMAADNNIAERGNCTDKDCNQHKQLGPAKFVNKTVTNLENESRAQLDYHGQLKTPIHSGNFMTYVWLTLEAHRDKQPCMLNVGVDITSVANGIPVGSILVPKFRFLQSLSEENEISEDDPVNDIKKLIHPRSRNEFSFATEYRRMVCDTDNWVKEQEEDEEVNHVFEEFVDYTSIFCLLCPINPNESDDAYAAVDTLRTITDSHGYDIMETDEIAKLEEEGLVSCDCWKYLHYCWCYHACAKAFKRGIIRAFPTNLDPRPQFQESRRGRPSIARKGGALTRA